MHNWPWLVYILLGVLLGAIFLGTSVEIAAFIHTCTYLAPAKIKQALTSILFIKKLLSSKLFSPIYCILVDTKKTSKFGMKASSVLHGAIYRFSHFSRDKTRERKAWVKHSKVGIHSYVQHCAYSRGL